MTKELEVKYGLPREVRFCRRCVMSNQRPVSEVEFKHTIETKKRTMTFDEEGICDACRANEQKERIEVFGIAETEGTAQMNAGAFRGGFGLDHALDGSYRHLPLL